MADLNRTTARPEEVLPGDPEPVRRRRALFLLEDLGGGTGNHVCQMLTEWSAAGWDVLVITQRPPLVRDLPAGVEVRVIQRAGWYDRFPVAQVRRLMALRRIARMFRPDVVHSYFFWSILYGRALRLLGDVPLLVENREDLGFSWGRGSYAALWATRRIPDRVVCVAEAVRRAALTYEGLDPRRTTVIRNGIQVRAASGIGRADARQKLGFGEGQVVVGMVANLPRAVKGGARLLDAVRPIVTAAPNVRFLLVGLGTEAAELEPALAARGIGGLVTGTGYRRDVETCYAAMDISVLTSMTEGLSITLLESMQHALPTVVTDVGGNAEVVRDGETGFLVPTGDTGAFVDRVVSLARDPARRRDMGEAGRRRVSEHFGIQTVARRYLEVYRELLAAALGSPQRSEAGAVSISA